MIIVSRDIRVDWARLVANLQRKGMSFQSIADAVGVSKAAVRGYASEDVPAEPAFWVGASLLVLWADKCSCSYTDAPTKRVLQSVSQVLRDTA
jgi:hypothetical protein